MSQFAPDNLRVPPGFEQLLEGLAREVLREQPPNIINFAAYYFRVRLAERDDPGSTSPSISSSMLPPDVKDKLVGLEMAALEEETTEATEDTFGRDDLTSTTGPGITSPPPNTNVTSEAIPESQSPPVPEQKHATMSPVDENESPSPMSPDGSGTSPPPPPEDRTASPPPNADTVAEEVETSSPPPAKSPSPPPDDATSPITASPPPPLPDDDVSQLPPEASTTPPADISSLPQETSTLSPPPEPTSPLPDTTTSLPPDTASPAPEASVASPLEGKMEDDSADKKVAENEEVADDDDDDGIEDDDDGIEEDEADTKGPDTDAEGAAAGAEDPTEPDQ